MGAVFKREFRGIFHSIFGYIYLSLFLFAAGIFVATYSVTDGNRNVEGILSNMTIVAALLIPLITVKMMLNENKKGNERFLALLPLKGTDIVLGKYFACLAVTAIPILAMTFYFVILGFFGDVNYMSAYLGLIVYFMFCSMFAAVYLFIAVASKSAIKVSAVSYSVSVGIFLLGFLGLVLRKIGGGIFEKIARLISPFLRVDDIIYGIFDFTTVIYFAIVSVLFLLLSIRKLEKRRSM